MTRWRWVCRRGLSESLTNVSSTHPFYIIAFILLLVLDLLLAATRSGFSQSKLATNLAANLAAKLAHLFSLPEVLQPQVRRAVNALASPPLLKASLDLTQAMTHFLLAGLALFLFLPWERLLYPLLTAAVLLGLVGLALFLLEWIVERRVALRPDEWVLRLAPLAGVLIFLLKPMVSVVLKLSTPAVVSANDNGYVTESGLMTLMDAEQENGGLEQGERKMIVSIFRLGDTLAREIMVPRIDVIALEANSPVPQAVDALLESGFSRVPVFAGSIDQIHGLLYAKDLLKAWREGGQMDSLEPLLREAYFIPEAKKVDELLAEMQAQRIHMAIVVDEYGGVAGLVTLEDIVEEIVGEIVDEYDIAEEVIYQVVSPGEYVFLGRVDLDDFNEIMESDLPKEEADTLAGFIFSRIGRVPIGGERVEIGNMRLTVEQVSGRRIRKVRAQRLLPATEQGDEEGHAIR